MNSCSITSPSEKLQDHLVASLRMKPQPKSGWSRARDAIRRACFGQARRDYIYQHAVQGSQPLLPEFSTYELADHIVQGQVTGWAGKL